MLTVISVRGSMVEFTLLGQITATHKNTIIDLPAGQPLSVLALLLLEPAEVVSVTRIANVLWVSESSMPGNPRNVIQRDVAKLRARLPDEPTCQIKYKAGGYLITACRDDIDWHRFQRLFTSARTSSDAVSAAELLNA